MFIIPFQMLAKSEVKEKLVRKMYLGLGGVISNAPSQAWFS